MRWTCPERDLAAEGGGTGQRALSFNSKPLPSLSTNLSLFLSAMDFDEQEEKDGQYCALLGVQEGVGEEG